MIVEIILKIWPGFFLSQRKIKRFNYIKTNYPDSHFLFYPLGNPILNAVFKIWPEDSPSRTYVIKQVSGILNKIKWLGVKIVSFTGVNYDINDSNRLQNEINGLKFCEKFSIDAPRLYDQLGNRVIVDFIDGIPLDEFGVLTVKELVISYKRFGKILAKIHDKKYSIGDVKAENVMLNRKTNELYVVDFEQFHKVGPTDKDILRHVWELSEFIFYLGHYFPRKNDYSVLDLIITAFLSSYFSNLAESSLSKRKQVIILESLGNLRYTWMYLLFMTPFTLLHIYKVVNEWKIKWKRKNPSFEYK
ncbi:MAG: hypothetical protein ACXAC7_10545 [Candidatus Hodarchaeales archaeon]